MAELLNIDVNCLKEYNPLKCSVQVADSINRLYRGYGDLPENYIANAVANSLNLNPRELARLLMGSPGSAILASHPLCWVKSFIIMLRAGRINIDGLNSGIKIYEEVVKSALRKCVDEAKRRKL